MHASLGHFKAMGQRRQERMDANNNKFKRGKEKITSLNGEFDFPRLTPEETVKMRLEIRSRLQRERQMLYLKWAVVFLITLALLYFIVLLYF